MSEPNSPSVPPAPTPAPESRPAPRFGEFAPVDPTSANSASDAPTGVPPAPAVPPPPVAAGYPQPVAGQTPGYGQPVAGQPVYGQPGFGAPAAPKRRGWDIVLTIVLLALGLAGMAMGIFYGLFLPALMDQLYHQYGLGDYVDDGSLAAPGLLIVVSHLLLYVIALGISILLLVKRKVAFYVPLIAGVIAAVVLWGTLVAVMLNDTEINRYLTGG